ncbi:winged helix-turn-helix domain-containing protein [Candidatus Pelagibacter sp.]|nr:winged helix-turn-helix domain-containing protein [Candidatus Pelagibacter sp.]
MNNENLVIYDFKILYEILNEISDHINFKLTNINKITDLDLIARDNYLVISNKKIKNIENQIEITNFPIDIVKLVENINIKFLKKKYSQQSDIDLGVYKLNLNSRKIYNSEKSLDLTEREANIIVFLNNSKKPVKISKLQTEVWGHNSKLETHTVETHIYRLRKKINDTFEDKNFIKSSKSGYIIK